MPKSLSDLWTYDEPLPERWMLALRNLQQAGDLVEAEKLRIEMELLITRSNVALYAEEQAVERAEKDLAAATIRASASDRIAKSLRGATWVLAGATVALVLATLLLALEGH